MDDFASDPSTTGLIAPGSRVQGRLETPSDRDWFAITLVRGFRYEFALTRSGTDPLPDPWLELRSASGELLALNDNDGFNFNSQLHWDATGSGTFYLEARSHAFGSSGTYTLRAGASRLPPTTLLGTDASEVLAGTAVDETFYGLAGDDTLVGHGGNDTLLGGDGRDEADYAAATAGVSVHLDGSASGGAGADVLSGIEDARGSGHADNLFGTSVANLLAGGAGDDLLLGHDGADTLRGQEGNDRLGGGRGADLLEGGSGDDVLDNFTLVPDADTLAGGDGNDYYLADDLDTLLEAPDGGNDTVQASRSFTLPDNLENLLFPGLGHQAAVGNALANAIDGGLGDDTLEGLAGDDTLDGGPGSDSLAGGPGDDLYRVDDALDVVVEDAGEGLDTVRSLVDFTLGNGVDNLVLRSAAVRGTGNDLANLVVGNGRPNALAGRSGNDTLSGDVGDDTLDGGNGDDLLQGGPGNDLVTGGAGNDLLRGGPGADLFGFADGSGRDRVAGFSVAEGDRLVLAAGVNGTGITDVAAALAAASQVGDHTVVDLGGGHGVTLLGVRLDDLAAAHFAVEG